MGYNGFNRAGTDMDGEPHMLRGVMLRWQKRSLTQNMCKLLNQSSTKWRKIKRISKVGIDLDSGYTHGKATPDPAINA